MSNWAPYTRSQASFVSRTTSRITQLQHHTSILGIVTLLLLTEIRAHIPNLQSLLLSSVHGSDTKAR